MRNTFKEEPFINEFNQKINVNDEVMFAATSWKSTRMKKGTFDGVYKNSEGEVVSIRIGNVLRKNFSYNYLTKEGRFDEVIGKSILPLKRVYKLQS